MKAVANKDGDWLSKLTTELCPICCSVSKGGPSSSANIYHDIGTLNYYCPLVTTVKPARKGGGGGGGRERKKKKKKKKTDQVQRSQQKFLFGIF